MRTIAIIITMVGLAAVPSARAQGCCGGKAGSPSDCSMAGKGTPGGQDDLCTGLAAAPEQNSSQRHVFMKPVHMGKGMIHCGQIKG